MDDLWFRIEDHGTAPSVDECGNAYGEGGVAFRLRTFKVVKTTPCGVRLQEVCGSFVIGNEPRFVLAKSHKRFACPTIEEAMVSWRARKARQRSIYSARLRYVERALEMAEREVGWLVLRHAAQMVEG